MATYNNWEVLCGIDLNQIPLKNRCTATVLLRCTKLRNKAFMRLQGFPPIFTKTEERQTGVGHQAAAGNSKPRKPYFSPLYS